MNTEVQFSSAKKQAAWDAMQARMSSVEAETHALKSRMRILEAVELGDPEPATDAPTFTTTTWQGGFPFDPEKLFGNVDTHRYQTTVAWIQVLVPDGNRYGMAVVALGDRNHDGLYRQGSGGTGRGYHLFHDRRFGRGELWDEQTNYSSFLIRDGKVLARPLGNIPGVKPFNVEVTGLRFGSTIDEGDHEADYAVGVPSYLADLPRTPETAVAAVLIRKRSGAGDNSFWPKPEVASVQIGVGGEMFLSVGGAFKSELGNPADDFLIDLEGGRVVTHGSRIEFDLTDAIRWDVRGVVPEWPS